VGRSFIRPALRIAGRTAHGKGAGRNADVVETVFGIDPLLPGRGYLGRHGDMVFRYNRAAGRKCGIGGDHASGRAPPEREAGGQDQQQDRGQPIDSLAGPHEVNGSGPSCEFLCDSFFEAV